MSAWLDWARKLAATAHNGLEYAENAYDVARYRDVRDVAAAMLANGGAGPIRPVLEVLDREQGYATPKVDVRALVLDDGRVLLVRERVDGRWCLAGGRARPTDRRSPSSARSPRRPATGCARAACSPAGTAASWRTCSRTPSGSDPPNPPNRACERLGEVVRDDSERSEAQRVPSLETDEVGWFAPSALPPLSLGRVNPGQIDRLIALAADPAAPAAFD